MILRRDPTCGRVSRGPGYHCRSHLFCLVTSVRLVCVNTPTRGPILVSEIVVFSFVFSNDDSEGYIHFYLSSRGGVRDLS